ncbi:hypothetical protein VaNZ11_005455, partial [Volvox africanus]
LNVRLLVLLVGVTGEWSAQVETNQEGPNSSGGMKFSQHEIKMPAMKRGCHLVTDKVRLDWNQVAPSCESHAIMLSWHARNCFPCYLSATLCRTHHTAPPNVAYQQMCDCVRSPYQYRRRRGLCYTKTCKRALTVGIAPLPFPRACLFSPPPALFPSLPMSALLTNLIYPAWKGLGIEPPSPSLLPSLRTLFLSSAGCV